MPRYETITEEFCPWPYSTPYTYTRAIKDRSPRKKATKKPAPKKRSPIAADLGTKKYRARVVPGALDEFEAQCVLDYYLQNKPSVKPSHDP